MRFLLPTLVAVCGLIGGPAFAAGDPAAGKAKAEVCGACHGENGISQMDAIPSLAGQHDKFLQWQLVYFRSGRRVADPMNEIAKDLTDADIRDLGAYFSSLAHSGPLPEKLSDEQRQAGEKAVADHRCASCHGDHFEGTDSVPIISHQHKDYLAKALQDYRSGKRPSSGVAAMNEAAASLSDTDITAIATYLEQVQ